MNIYDSFPSPYVKAADLNGKSHAMTIRLCVSEELGQGADKELKPVLYFQKAQKGLVLNKTNARVIADAYGVETAAWEGRPVEIYPTQVEFRGNMVDGIRLRIPAAASTPAAPPAAAPPTVAPMTDDLNDSIGF